MFSFFLAWDDNFNFSSSHNKFYINVIKILLPQHVSMKRSQPWDEDLCISDLLKKKKNTFRENQWGIGESKRILSVGKLLKLHGKFPGFKLFHLGVGREMGSSSLRTILQKELVDEHESTEIGERVDNKNIQKGPEKIWTELSKITALYLCRFLCISYF